MKKYLPWFAVVALGVFAGFALAWVVFVKGREQAQRALADAGNAARGPVGFAQLPPAAL